MKVPEDVTCIIGHAAVNRNGSEDCSERAANDSRGGGIGLGRDANDLVQPESSSVDGAGRVDVGDLGQSMVQLFGRNINVFGE